MARVGDWRLRRGKPAKKTGGSGNRTLDSLEPRGLAFLEFGAFWACEITRKDPIPERVIIPLDQTPAST